MFGKIIDAIYYIVVGLIIAMCLFVLYELTMTTGGHEHEEYIEIVDKYITYNRSGTPYYYVVYKFVDGCIEEVMVSSTEYYRTRRVENE